MKKYIYTAAILLAPAVALADHPEGTYLDEIRSEIRDDHRQLQEDRDAGFTEAAKEDEKQLAEDQLRLREAVKHPHRETPRPILQPKVQPAAPVSPPLQQHRDVKPHVLDERGDQVYAAPPEQTEHDEWRPGNNVHINPDRTFNHSAHVDNEIR